MKRSFVVVGLIALFSLALTSTRATSQTAKPQTISGAVSRASISHGSGAGSQQPRDIVFIIMDDVGIDEMTVFGWGAGVTLGGKTLPPPDLPNINAIALSGVMFGNTWAMPECSPSRVNFFTGRYPMRTGVTSALVDNMLPTSQTSPYETTIPRVLEQAGYNSALIGKFHLGIANPLGNCSPAALGWNHYDGYTGASPGSIDTTAGNGLLGVMTGDFECGFNQSKSPGACYQSDGSCMIASNGKACLDSGGLFLEGERCTRLPSFLDFTRLNSYYVWDDLITDGPIAQNTGPGECSAAEPVISRIHQTTAQGDAAVAWWKAQPGPRMITLAYSIEHTPFQQPPGSPADVNALSCQSITPGDRQPRVDQYEMANAMMSSLDSNIGLVLQGMGLATLDGNGVIKTEIDSNGNRHIPELEKSGVMLVIIGDNGQFATLVEDNFDRSRAKGSVYQTGVWVPLIVAGSLVQGTTGRIDNHLINSVDLFQLFGEIAGLDVNQIVAPAHALDSRPMLVHLTNPDHGETRAYNFTQLGPGTFEVPTNNQTRSWPCVLGGRISSNGPVNTNIDGGTCVDVLFSARNFCEQENGGVWFGPPDDTDVRPLQFPNPDPRAYERSWSSCCSVRQALNSTPGSTALVPVNQWAERDTRYKYVELETADCSKPLCPGPMCNTVFPPFETTTVAEFYDVQVNPDSADNPAGMDYADSNLCSPKNPCVPPPALQSEFDSLRSALNAQRASEVTCAGDGNLDKRVNQFDLEGVIEFLGGPPSIWDFNNHATTDVGNLVTVAQNLGSDCISLCVRADLNRDGVVNGQDLAILQSNVGKPCELCGSDLNGDGVVNEADVAIMRQAIASCGAATKSAGGLLPVKAGK